MSDKYVEGTKPDKHFDSVPATQHKDAAQPFEVQERDGVIVLTGRQATLTDDGKKLSNTLNAVIHGEATDVTGETINTAGKPLVVNLEGRFITSDGLAALVRASQAMQKNGGRMIVAVGSEAREQIFDEKGLAKFFHFEPDLEEALQAAKAGAGTPGGGVDIKEIEDRKKPQAVQQF